MEWAMTTITHSGKADAVTLSAEFDLGDCQGWIITDKHWLLENLLCYMSNAVKFVSEGSIVIRASAVYDDTNENCHQEKPDNCYGVMQSSTNEEVAQPEKPVYRLFMSKSDSFSSGGADSDTSQAKPIKFICFSVTDTGIGIPEDKMDGLFRPFFQAQRCAGGTGLGFLPCRSA
jgi:signal transduction histidine kinase